MAYELRYYQEDAIKFMFDYINRGGRAGLAVLPTACHAKGQQIIMYDGLRKRVEDIVVGDKLLAPDSTARTVLQLFRGRQEMRKVTPHRFGDSFIVNKDHKLSLFKTKCVKNPVYPSGNSGYSVQTVAEWEESSAWNKHIHKLWKPNCVSFGTEIMPVIEPRFLGLMLGDGSMIRSVAVTSMDEEVHAYCDKYVQSQGDTVRVTNNGSKADTHHYVGQNIMNMFRAEGLYGCTSFTKFIPDTYLRASVSDRFKLLAGLVDSNGHVQTKGHTIEYTTVSKQLCSDMLFLIRSLGFTATYTEKETSWTHNGVKNYSTAFRIHFSGDTTQIPLIINRNKVRLSKPNQRHNNCTAFTVEQLPEDDYYGFELDGDHLYMIDDFTVQHNSGKSLVIAEAIKRILLRKNQVRAMMLTHVGTLITQNFEKIKSIWPTAPAGIYSAGIGYRQYSYPITYGGVQSCYKKPELFGHIDILFIDEAHLVSDKAETMYGAMIEGLKSKNPNLVVIGLTATPYRMGMGSLTSGPIFDDIFYDISSLDDFVRLVDEGYLSDLLSIRTDTEMDLSAVKMIAGEYSEKSLDENLNRDEVTKDIVDETIRRTQDRNKGLAFCVSKSHAENMAMRFTERGYPAAYVHSGLSNEQCEEILAHFAEGRYKVVTNMGKLTTGYDRPDIDFIVNGRPTNSTPLHVQILGRGARVHPSKENTLILDFANNISRLGPINDPVLPTKKGEAKGDAPIRICDVCGTINHASAKVCKQCGNVFPPAPLKFSGILSGAEAIKRKDIPVIEDSNVSNLTINKYISSKGNTTVKMSFFTDHGIIDEYLMFDSSQRASYGESMRKVEKFKHKIPLTRFESTEDALVFLQENLIQPSMVRVWTNKPTNTGKRRKAILDYKYEGE